VFSRSILSKIFSSTLVCATAVLSVAVCLSAATAAHALAPTVYSPTDALTPEEYWTIYKVLRASGHTHEKTLYPSILLHEPLKSYVLAWKPGDPIKREADVVLYDEGKSYAAEVDITNQKVLDFHQLDKFQEAPFTSTEEHAFDDVIKHDPRVVEALKKRGITDLNLVECYTSAAGFIGRKEQDGRRIGWGGCFYSEGMTHPMDREIGGIFTVEDMAAHKVLDVRDYGIVPMPANSSIYDNDGGPAAPGTKPIVVSQPGGPSFTIKDGLVSWGNWRFRYRLDPRVGPIIQQAGIMDNGKLRSVLYEGSLSEMFVPYQDQEETWNSHVFLDAGEYFMDTGLGMIKPLYPGIDCPDYATFVSGTFYKESGQPFQRAQLACIFERTAGDASWRHMDDDGTIYGRPGRELVFRTVAVVGNYDYVLDYRFEQEGAIKIAVGATGVLEVKPVKEQKFTDEHVGDFTGKDANGPLEFGHLVAPGIDGVDHDHFFSFRLDLDVDGTKNSFMDDKLVQYQLNPTTGRKTIWAMQPTMPSTESGAIRDIDPKHPEMWRFANTAVKNSLGYPSSFEIMAGETGISLLSPDDWPQIRGNYSSHILWVTPYEPDERYSAGVYVPGSKGTDGLAVWTKKDRNIMDTDIVAWYTMGFHHVPRPEDWPQMPTMWHDFTIRPFDFFDKSPLMDLPMQP
jgi:primary-amine oxidase